MKKIILLIMCFVAIQSTSFAQVCDGPLTVEIAGSESASPLEITEESVTQPTCAGPTGAIEVEITGGTPTYTVVWNRNGEFFSSDEDLMTAGAGTYDVLVTDASGCTVTLGPWTLTEPSDLVVTGVTTDVTCNTEDAIADGSITLTVEGGTPDYTYTWTTTDGSGLTAGVADQTGLSAGTYTVDVMDAAGCNTVEEFTITAPDAFAVSLDPTDPDCNSGTGGGNGEISTTVEGGSGTLTYTWATTDGNGLVAGAANQTGLSAGTYSVTVTDGTCTATSEVTLEGANPIVVTPTATDATCSADNGDGDGTITLDVTGGDGSYTFVWTTSDGSGLDASAQNQTGLSAGTYDVEVSDGGVCMTTASITIEGGTPIVVDAGSTNPNCFDGEDGTITINSISGGAGSSIPDYTLTWEAATGIVAGAATQTGLAAGTYTVTVTDTNDCSTEETFTLESGDEMAITETTVDPSCHADDAAGDGSISITMEGGDGSYTYAWSTTDGSGIVDATAQNQSGLTAGTYTIEVMDGVGCSTWKDITLEGPDAIEVDATAASPGCFGSEDGTITVNSITGGTGSDISDYTLTWSTTDGDGLTAGSATQTGLTAGNYNLVVTDANNCSASFDYEITEPSELVLTEDLVQQLSCHHDSGEADGAIEISVSGGSGNYTYTWTTTNGSGLVAGDEDQSGLSAGAYTVEIMDGTGCSITETYQLVEPAVVAIGHTIIPGNCEGDAASIWTAVSGGQGSAPTDYTYVWSTINGSGLTPGTVHQQNLGAGTYSLTVSDSNGCSNSAEFVIDPVEAVLITADVTSEITCNGGEAELTLGASGGSAPYTYSIDDGDTFETDPVFAGVAAGTYTVVVKDSNGCEAEMEVTVEEPAQLMAGTCTEVQDLCQVSEGEIKVEVAGGVAPYVVEWSSSNGGTLNEASGQTIAADGGSFTFTGAEGGKTYSFVIRDANGCEIP